MLEILITPNSLVFKNLTDDMHKSLTTEFELKITYDKDEWILEGSGDMLYKALLKLAYKYDIEII